MHGNVYEWTADCWNNTYTGAPTNGGAWESGDCSRRVLRGGSWYVYPWSLRASDRFNFSAGTRYYEYGFRLAQDSRR